MSKLKFKVEVFLQPVNREHAAFWQLSISIGYNI